MIPILLTELSTDLKLVKKLINPFLMNNLVMLEKVCSESVRNMFSKFFGIIWKIKVTSYQVSMGKKVNQTKVVGQLEDTNLKENKRKLNEEFSEQQKKRKREA